MEGTFSFAGLDENDVELVERHWNAWVGELRARGLQPSEGPISWTDTSMTYALLPIHFFAEVS